MSSKKNSFKGYCDNRNYEYNIVLFHKINHPSFFFHDPCHGTGENRTSEAFLVNGPGLRSDAVHMDGADHDGFSLDAVFVRDIEIGVHQHGRIVVEGEHPGVIAALPPRFPFAVKRRHQFIGFFPRHAGGVLGGAHAQRRPPVTAERDAASQPEKLRIHAEIVEPPGLRPRFAAVRRAGDVAGGEVPGAHHGDHASVRHPADVGLAEAFRQERLREVVRVGKVLDPAHEPERAPLVRRAEIVAGVKARIAHVDGIAAVRIFGDPHAAVRGHLHGAERAGADDGAGREPRRHAGEIEIAVILFLFQRFGAGNGEEPCLREQTVRHIFDGDAVLPSPDDLRQLGMEFLADRIRLRHNEAQVSARWEGDPEARLYGGEFLRRDVGPRPPSVRRGRPAAFETVGFRRVVDDVVTDGQSSVRKFPDIRELVRAPAGLFIGRSLSYDMRFAERESYGHFHFPFTAASVFCSEYSTRVG